MTASSQQKSSTTAAHGNTTPAAHLNTSVTFPSPLRGVVISFCPIFSNDAQSHTMRRGTPMELSIYKHPKHLMVTLSTPPRYPAFPRFPAQTRLEEFTLALLIPFSLQGAGGAAPAVHVPVRPLGCWHNDSVVRASCFDCRLCIT